MSPRLRSSAEGARNQSERPAPAFELLESKLLPTQGSGGAVLREALIEVMEASTRGPGRVPVRRPGLG
jgi:hypothetical protein